MNGKTLIPLVAGLGIGGFALWMGFNTLRTARAGQHTVPTVQLWCAQTDIPRGTEIGEGMLKAAPYPANLAPAGAIQDKDKVLGRVPRVDAPAGLPVLETMLLAPGERAGLYVKPGFRAVAVKVDEASSVGGHVSPGCYVDVAGSFPVRRGNKSETLAQVVAENVEVAAVGPRISVVKGSEGDDKKGDRAVRDVTLFVKPDDVPKLLLAEQKGRIKLSLRNHEDEEGQVSKRPVSDLELTGQVEEEEQKEEKRAEMPSEESLLAKLRQSLGIGSGLPRLAVVAAPAATWAVTVWRGEKPEKVCFASRDSRERVEDQPAGAPAGVSAAVPGSAPPAADGDGSDEPQEPEPEELQE